MRIEEHIIKLAQLAKRVSPRLSVRLEASAEDLAKKLNHYTFTKVARGKSIAAKKWKKMGREHDMDRAHAGAAEYHIGATKYTDSNTKRRRHQIAAAMHLARRNYRWKE